MKSKCGGDTRNYFVSWFNPAAHLICFMFYVVVVVFVVVIVFVVVVVFVVVFVVLFVFVVVFVCC